MLQLTLADGTQQCAKRNFQQGRKLSTLAEGWGCRTTPTSAIAHDQLYFANQRWDQQLSH